MALWCRNVPTVDVPRRDMPKPVTLVVPYYEAPRFFARQFQGWCAYPEDLRAVLRVIVVDDGSPQWPAADVLPAESPRPVDLRLFRIAQDIRWNWLAARNIGMWEASSGWCLLTDIDHVVTADLLRAVVYSDHDPRVVYAFHRQEHTGEVVSPHSASFLLTRDLFWRIGGYDEALSGHYGTDGDWRRRVAAVAPMALLPELLVRYEFVEDSSTTAYQRKQPEDAAVKGLIAKRGLGWRPKVLSFSYHEVTARGE